LTESRFGLPNMCLRAPYENYKNAPKVPAQLAATICCLITFTLISLTCNTMGCKHWLCLRALWVYQLPIICFPWPLRAHNPPLLAFTSAFVFYGTKMAISDVVFISQEMEKYLL
jgi:hypothetical protein